PPLRVSRTAAATMLTAFEHVVLVSERDVLRERDAGNVVLLASASALPAAALARAAARGPLPDVVLERAGVAGFAGDARPPPGTARVPPTRPAGQRRTAQGPRHAVRASRVHRAHPVLGPSPVERVPAHPHPPAAPAEPDHRVLDAEPRAAGQCRAWRRGGQAGR